MSETVTDVIAGAIIVVAIGNLFFLISAYRTYRAVLPPSPILFALLGVGVVTWLFGVWVAVASARYLVDLPPLPLGGIGFGVGILAVMMLPAFIWYQVRKFSSVITERDDRRDLDRDEARDAARDVERDTERDVARDVGRDAPRDLVRDTQVNEARNDEP